MTVLSPKSWFGKFLVRWGGSRHRFKYRLALVRDGVCMLRYDNEAGKGDHRHFGNTEERYAFTDTDTLLADFWRDVATAEAMK